MQWEITMKYNFKKHMYMLQHDDYYKHICNYKYEKIKQNFKWDKKTCRELWNLDPEKQHNKRMRENPIYAYQILYQIRKPWYSIPCDRLGNPFNEKDPSKVSLYIEEATSCTQYPKQNYSLNFKKGNINNE